MKINAYIMAADPAWIEASVLSYYNLVERIVVSYDQDSRGWTGAPIQVEECLRRLRAIDRDGKMDYRPGHYARLEGAPLENDSYQRQCALEQAATGADWVMQLDTDEIALDAQTVAESLSRAASMNMAAVEYPSRWFYQGLGNGCFLESCDRLWRPIATYPGPIAVKPTVKFRCARQCDVESFRVDFRSINTDPARPASERVDRVIPAEKGIVHLSWVRTEQDLQAKFAAWGHAREQDWSSELSKWIHAKRRPLLAMLRAPFRRKGLRHQVRITRLGKDVRRLLERSEEFLAVC